MTLCIAAECEIKDGSLKLPAIVLCCDWRAQTGHEGGALVGADDAYKIKKIDNEMYALLAGNPSDARELITACKTATNNFIAEARIATIDDVDVVVREFQIALRTAAGLRKAEIIENHVLNRFGASYKEFRHTPRDQQTEFHSHIWSEIQLLNLNADLIFCGFCAEVPVIVRLDRYARTPWVSNYDAIGTGSEVARAMLCLQPWSQDATGPITPVRLNECLYRVFEAKNVAHVADPQSVGEPTSFQIVVAKNGAFGITPKFFQRLVDEFNLKHCVPGLSTDDIMDVIDVAEVIPWRGSRVL
jgi:20S proteasome alpha/beta subunit